MASESKSNIDVKIFVVAKIERREKYGITYVFCENEVRLMTFPPKFFDVLKTNKHYLCRGVAIGETVRLYESSRVSFIPKMCILQQKVVHVYVFLKKTDSGSTKGVTSKCKQENSFKLSMVQF